ncbi:hypothetical protein EMPS_09920 [Entomortierella parvispora]|uniref:Uncharacterized protein n=1 Tax=Entomortierella parvispora TaxID=205924 RepID=A0A9P3M0H9_9FUNG|nr:hypothetical protein EMPS_09920 [Entomortierella parvispora]
MQRVDVDTKEAIIDLLGESQALLSDHMEEVQAACMKAHVEVFQGCLSDDWEGVDITDLLPTDFQIRDPKRQKEPVVRVAKVSRDLLKKITKSKDKNAQVAPDLCDLFSQNFLGFLAEKLLPSDRDWEPKEKKKRKTEKENNHPDWTTLVECVQKTASDDNNFREKRRMPTRIIADTKHFSQDDCNQHCQYLERKYLRRPKEGSGSISRENSLATLGEECRKAARKPRNRVESSKKLFSLLDQLDRTVHKCTKEWSGSTLILADPTGNEPLYSCVDRVQRLLRLINIASTQSQGSTDDVDHQEVMLGDDSDYDDEEMDEDDVFRETLEEEAKEEEVKGDSENATSDPCDAVAAEKELMRKAEPTSKRLRGLEAVICKLLDIGELSGLITKDIVRQHLFDRHTFKENEVDAAVKIINALRPFTPNPTPGTIPRHVLATGPFAYLANHLLRAMGFGNFTKKPYPTSAAGKLHPLPLGSTGIREALCSSKKEHFDVFDAKGTLC